jgi:hypothetical protein
MIVSAMSSMRRLGLGKFVMPPTSLGRHDAVVLHAHEHPPAMQPLAFQRELQVAACQPVMRIAFGNPVAPVPQLHRAAAVLALGDGALEIAIVERVVLDLDGQALVVRITRGPARHGPGLEDAVELEAEVVVQAGRVVALDHETPLRGRRPRLPSCRFGRSGDIPLAVRAFVMCFRAFAERGGYQPRFLAAKSQLISLSRTALT